MTTNYLKDPKYHYSFAQWCSNQVPGATEEEHYTVSKIIESVKQEQEGYPGSCQEMETFLMNKQHKLARGPAAPGRAPSHSGEANQNPRAGGAGGGGRGARGAPGPPPPPP